MSAATSVIDVQDVHKRYGPRGPEALKGVSFSVEPGEVFGLLGPNGAGKTTAIGVLTTRVRLTDGSASVDGVDVTTDPQGVKRRIAVVPQQANLDRALTARENLTFHGAYFGVRRAARGARADELLDQFGLADRATERVDNYSGGMSQRLMIARALMHQPVVLFLDEPTTGLDPQSRLFLWDRVAELRAAGTTILLTTHDMAEADRLCDRIAIVDHGQRIALDTPEGLRGLLPGANGVELVVRAGQDPVAAFEPIGTAESMQLDDDRWQVRCFGDPTLSALIDAAEQHGSEVLDVHRLEGSLEDVFVHLTGRDLR
ncbi:MAG: ABC transporter ATP-binding protein [Nocardioides sp.]|nr:ABC transporter ATP-binding protein [Nocardioides sp.]